MTFRELITIFSNGIAYGIVTSSFVSLLGYGVNKAMHLLTAGK